MKLGRALVTILLALSVPSIGLAQLATLQGTVRDTEGHAVAGAKLTITLRTGSVLLRGTAVADTNGHFEVPGLPAQRDYDFQVEADCHSKWIGAQFNLQSGPNTIDPVLGKVPSCLSVAEPSAQVTVLERLEPGVMIPAPPPESYLVTVLPGFSYKILAERLRPFRRLSTQALFAQFNQLRGEYREDEGKAELRAESLVTTLTVRKQVDTHLEEKLRTFDEKYGTNLSSVASPERDEHPRESNQTLRARLDVELNAYSHHFETLSRLRATVAELVRRDSFGPAEAKDYFEFLYRNGLTENEIKIHGIAFIEGVSYDPVKIVSSQDDLKSSLKRLSGSSRVWISHSGVALGFLEADPAEDRPQLVAPGNITLSRTFVPITGSIPDSATVYKIRLWIYWPDLPPGMSKRADSPDVQTIATNGQLQRASWTFQVTAAKPFGQLQLPLHAELQEYSAGNVAAHQTIDVPVPIVTIVPGPTGWDRFLATLKNLFGSVGGLLSTVLAIIAIYDHRERFRKFFSGQAKKWGSLGRHRLNAIIGALRPRQRD